MRARQRRILELALATFAAFYAALLVLGEAGRGFPDGYVSELDRALRAPRVGVALVALGIGAVLARGGSTPRVGVALALALGVLVLVEWAGFPWLGFLLGFADGGGG